MKQEKHHADLGECQQYLVGLHPIEHTRPDQHTCKDLAHNAGLSQALAYLGHDLRRAENEQESQWKRRRTSATGEQ